MPKTYYPGGSGGIDQITSSFPPDESAAPNPQFGDTPSSQPAVGDWLTNFFNAFGRSFGQMPIARLIGSGVHAAEGTLGQHAPTYHGPYLWNLVRDLYHMNDNNVMPRIGGQTHLFDLATGGNEDPSSNNGLGLTPDALAALRDELVRIKAQGSEGIDRVAPGQPTGNSGSWFPSGLLAQLTGQSGGGGGIGTTGAFGLGPLMSPGVNAAMQATLLQGKTI